MSDGLEARRRPPTMAWGVENLRFGGSLGPEGQICAALIFPIRDPRTFLRPPGPVMKTKVLVRWKNDRFACT
eukprot:3211351-Pyramimonas_sp.AAC.1